MNVSEECGSLGLRHRTFSHANHSLMSRRGYVQRFQLRPDAPYSATAADTRVELSAGVRWLGSITDGPGVPPSTE